MKWGSKIQISSDAICRIPFYLPRFKLFDKVTRLRACGRHAGFIKVNTNNSTIAPSIYLPYISRKDDGVCPDHVFVNDTTHIVAYSVWIHGLSCILCHTAAGLPNDFHRTGNNRISKARALAKMSMFPCTSTALSPASSLKEENRGHYCCVRLKRKTERVTLADPGQN